MVDLIKFADHVAPSATPQTIPLLGKTQVQNNQGGYVFQSDDFDRLERFLIIGTEGGTFYSGEQELTADNSEVVLRCMVSDADKTLDMIRTISVEGRAPKNDYAIFAISLLVGMRYNRALTILNDVCRTGTHLLQFVSAVTRFRKLSTAIKKAIGNWYNAQDADAIAYQVSKYQRRANWSHRDVLRLCHVKPSTEKHNLVFQWVIEGSLMMQPDPAHLKKRIVVKPKAGGVGPKPFTYKIPDLALLPNILFDVEGVKKCNVEETCAIINEGRLVREHIPTYHLNSSDVWGSLLARMPMTALLRNLGKMSNVGLLSPMGSATQYTALQLMDKEIVKKSRVHPFQVLTSAAVYGSGRGVRGSLSWTPDNNILGALDETFYHAFQNVSPAGKRFLLAVDTSSSMQHKPVRSMQRNKHGKLEWLPTPVHCSLAAAAMTLVTVRTEPLTHVIEFNTNSKVLPITKRTSLLDTLNYFGGWGGTDCAQPMLYATENKIETDVFVIYTDNETGHGQVHPCVALDNYRRVMGIPAKLVVVAMTANGFTIADPDDPNALDVAGFDSATPKVISDFVRN